MNQSILDAIYNLEWAVMCQSFRTSLSVSDVPDARLALIACIRRNASFDAFVDAVEAQESAASRNDRQVQLLELAVRDEMKEQ